MSLKSQLWVRTFVLIIGVKVFFQPISVFANPESEIRGIQAYIQLVSNSKDLLKGVRRLKDWAEMYCNDTCDSRNHDLLANAFKRVSSKVSGLKHNKNGITDIHKAQQVLQGVFDRHIKAIVENETLRTLTNDADEKMGNLTLSELRNIVIPRSFFPELFPASIESLPCSDFASVSSHPVQAQFPVLASADQANSAVIEPCCKTIQIEPLKQSASFPPTVILPYEDFLHDPNKDPYFTGDEEKGPPSSWGFVAKPSYTYDRAKIGSLGGHFIDRIPFSLPQIKDSDFGPHQDAWKTYYAKRLKEELKMQSDEESKLQEIAPQIGHGANSTVFLLFSESIKAKEEELRAKMPSRGQLMKLYRDSGIQPAAVPEKWLQDQLEPIKRSINQGVLKIRSPRPGTADIHDHDPEPIRQKKWLHEAAAQARRDLVLAKLYEQCSDAFAYKDEDGHRQRLIRVAKYNQDPAETGRGIFKQDAVVGGVEAHHISHLIQQGNAPELQRLGFKDLDEAKGKIAALESFYRETHKDVIHFLKTNGIPVQKNALPGEGLSEVGFDYNKGRNVMWDPVEKVFVAIDF